jgi:predicted Zn-dependent protease
MPHEYKIPDTLPGISRCQLSTEIRKLYLFKKGDATAEKLSVEKRKQLLLQLIESLEPREAEVVIGILSKDLGVKGLNYKFVKEAFPQLLP